MHKPTISVPCHYHADRRNRVDLGLSNGSNFQVGVEELDERVNIKYGPISRTQQEIRAGDEMTRGGHRGREVQHKTTEYGQHSMVVPATCAIDKCTDSI